MLLQKGNLIAYASNSLTSCQRNYAQIEKEMLAIVCGCTKFQDYIYGLPKITVETDHKPLEAILQKPLHQAPTRLQKMIMSIQKYSLLVEYKSRKQLYIADTLSRSPLPQFKQYDIQHLPISEAKLTTIIEETNQDQSLQDLLTAVKQGWPQTKQEAPPGARPYWNFRDEISQQDGTLQGRESDHSHIITSGNAQNHPQVPLRH